MKRAIACISIAVVTLMALMVITTPAAAEDTGRLHLIVFAQDPDTEISVKVGDAKRNKELVDAGVTYLSYKTDSTDLSVLAYGDSITPRVDKGRDGDHYAIVCINQPGESVGE